MWEAFISGFFNVFSPLLFLTLCLGTLAAVIVGIIPGIGAMLAISLLMPFAYGMKDSQALVFLVTIGAVAMTGGSMTAILVNVPGTASNAATCIDGFPLTQKGEGMRAIGAALTSSALGGVLGVVLALVMIPLVVPLIMNIFMAETFFLVVLGICFLATLSEEGQVIKGLMGGIFGLMTAFIGLEASTGIARYTFGSDYLYDGIGIVPLVLGLFAGAELIDLAASRRTITKVGMVASNWKQLWQGVKDVFLNKWLCFRSCVIGYIVGVIPGLGGTAAMFIAYGQAKQTSKHRTMFGQGEVAGVIAPESANNACYGGELLTTLSFGIPGGPPMALLLGAFLMVGIQPGPGLLVDHPELCFTLFWASAVASILAALICVLVLPYLIKIVTVPPDYLLSLLAVFIFTGVFADTQNVSDLFVVLVFTGIGLVMKKSGFSRPAFLLAFVLGRMVEKYFWLAYTLQGPFFFTRPVSLLIITLIIFIFNLNLLRSGLGKLFRRE